MNSTQIQESVYNWARSRKDFTAPYGVLFGEHISKNGTKYKYITFGKARILDATVEIYNRNFIVLRTSSTGREIFKNYESLIKVIELL